MIATYWTWAASYVLIAAAGEPQNLLWRLTWTVPLAVLATVVCHAWDGAEARIERQWRQHYQEQAIARRLEQITRAREIEARVSIELPNDEEWAREVMRLLEIEDLSDCSAGAQHSDSDDERTN